MTDTKINPKSRGLGRGLNALFEDDETDYTQALTTPATANESAASGRGKTMLGLDLLQPGKGQPRKVFNPDSLAELASSIKQHGILQPLLVREIAGNAGQYEIIAGERRWRAAQKAQLHEVPVIILNISDAEAFEIALIENLQREDLDPIEEATGYQKLMQDFSYTQEKLAESLGKSRSHVANMMRLLQLPPSVQGYLSEGKLTIGHARALIPAADDARILAKEIIEKNMSVRETEKFIADILGRAPKDRPAALRPSAKAKDTDTLALERDVSNMLGMRVTITPHGQRTGMVTILYKSLDQLDDIVLRLTKLPDLRGTEFDRADYVYQGPMDDEESGENSHQPPRLMD